MKTLPITDSDRFELNMRARFLSRYIGVFAVIVFIFGIVYGLVEKAGVVMGLFYVAGPLELLLGITLWISVAPLYRDLREGQKIAGEFPVQKDIVSTRWNNSFYLTVKEHGIKKVLVSKEVYDNVLPGDLLYMEVAVHSRYPFQVRRNGVSVVPGKP